MRTLNIGMEEIQKEIEPVHNLYRNSPNDILDGDIDNIMANTVNTKLDLFIQSL